MFSRSEGVKVVFFLILSNSWNNRHNGSSHL